MELSLLSPWSVEPTSTLLSRWTRQLSWFEETPRMYVTAAQNLMVQFVFWRYIASSQQTQDVESMLVLRWSSVVDGGPLLNQHWLNVSCLLGGCTTSQHRPVLVSESQQIRGERALCWRWCNHPCLFTRGEHGAIHGINKKSQSLWNFLDGNKRGEASDTTQIFIVVV